MKTFKAAVQGHEHQKAMMLTSFWQLFDYYNQEMLLISKHRKCDLILVQIIKSFNVSIGFVIGGKHVQLTPTRVTKIFGIPCVGERLDIFNNYSRKDKFLLKNFTSRGQLQKTQVELAINTVKATEDVAKLICIMLCSSLFFPNTRTSSTWFLAKCLVSTKEMNKYNWALTI